MTAVSPACDFGCGWIAGVCGLVVGHPMDTIKVRQQTLGGVSAWKCAVTTIKYEGVLALYKGMSFPMLSAGVMNSVFFGVYGSTLRVMESWGLATADNPSLSAVFAAGCMGGLGQVGIACPVDLVKIKLQAQTGTTKAWGVHYEAGYRGPVDCLAGIFKAEGIRGFFRGMVPMLYRDIPASGTYMLVYQGLMRLLQNTTSEYSTSLSILIAGGLAGVDVPSFGVYMVVYQGISQVLTTSKDSSLSLFTTLMAGGLAGSISWSIIMPLDVIKSRLQADRPDKPQYRGMLHCFVDSYKKDGFRVFGRGYGMVMLRAFPVNAAIFLGYEHCIRSCQSVTIS